MTTLLEKFNKEQEKKIPQLRPGDTVKVHQKIKDGDKERVQIFEGIIIAKKHGKGVSAMITVRKVIDGIGVERIFPIHSPALEKIEVMGHGKVRRSKLNYLRTAKGTKSRLKKKEFAVAIAPEEPVISETTEPIITEGK
ncbi:MAG: 50S ribosomal protein L19 [Candidatus Staskawiczbacteria bacterium]|nr:50S ribosomal protein L19 [Candidatus Staskawiczbacteria bacterium]